MRLDIILILLQIVLTAVTSSIAYFQLKKEFRKRTKIALKEAKHTLRLIFFLALLTIVVQVISYYISDKSQRNLENQLNKITRYNINLKKKLNNVESKIVNKLDSTEAQIALKASNNALRASKEIDNSKKTLSSYLNGSDISPRFTFISMSNPPRFALENLDTVRAYIDAFIVNYDEIIKCPRLNGRVDWKCYLGEISPIPWIYILPKKLINIDLPKYSTQNEKSKFIISITLTKSQFKIQVFILRVPAGTILCTRTLQKVKNNYKVIQVDDKFFKINWEKEFSLPLNELFADIN